MRSRLVADGRCPSCGEQDPRHEETRGRIRYLCGQCGGELVERPPVIEQLELDLGPRR